MTDQAAVCARADCPVATTGQCALQHDPVDSCPDYDPEGLDFGDEEEEDSSESIPSNIKLLRSSEVLREEHLVDFRQAHRSTTVALVGDIGAGKTTLLSAIYEAMCRGTFPEHRFRSSLTLTGFARRHHLSLVESGNVVPGTERTSGYEGASFYHLNVVDTEDRPSHLIMADRSGEAFRAARVNTVLISDIRELRIADRVCFLLDADRVTSLETRAGYRREFRQLIWALIDNEAIREGVPLEVLTTKIDKLNGQNPGELESDLAEFEASLGEELSKAGLVVTVHRICSLPSSNYEMGPVGIDGLLGRWLSAPNVVSTAPKQPEHAVRAIDRLLEFWTEM